MRASIIQLRDLRFISTHIDIDPKFEGNAPDFDFEGANFKIEVTHDHRDEDPLKYWVALEYGLMSSDETVCPYVIDIKAVGFIDVAPSVSEDRREELVFENGAALVYGAIRELVATITGRGLYGVLTLPTATFIGAYADAQKTTDEAPPEKDIEGK